MDSKGKADTRRTLQLLDDPGGTALTLPEPLCLAASVMGRTTIMAHKKSEYCSSTKVTEKIDVYSFGVVLLELVTGKEAHYGDEDSNLAEWAWRHYRQERPLIDIFDKEVKKDCFLEEMTHVFMLGLMCTDKLPASRPPMKVVLQALQRCNCLEGPGGANDVNKPDSDVPLLGNGRHISSCRNSRGEIKEDDHVMVSVL